MEKDIGAAIVIVIGLFLLSGISGKLDRIILLLERRD